MLAGLVAARRITRPVANLIAVTRAMTARDHSARAGPIRAPAEPRELASAFDQMAATPDRQEQIRRNFVAAVAHELRTRSPCCRPVMKRWQTAHRAHGGRAGLAA